MKDIIFSTASALARAIRTKQVSAVEVLEAHLAQIGKHNPTLNAIVTMDIDAARQRAQAADAALAHGETWGPLHGVPVTLKDSISVAGMRTTVGFEPLADYIPPHDSTIAARLRSAGAIILGKTNVPVMVSDFQADNPIFGRTNNPWDLTRTPGGSSGGPSAAVAAGLVPLDMGSDIGGSIRVPAHFCGVYGLKPTEHRVSLFGHIPDLPGSPRGVRIMGTIGPIARDVEDLDLALRVIAGPDGHDTEVPPVVLSVEETPRLKDLRIAWAPTFPGVPAQQEIQKAVENLAGELARLGCRVEERLPEIDFAYQNAVFWELVKDVMYVFQPLPEGTQPTSLASYLKALDQRDALILAWEKFFEDWDVLLCPVCMMTAFEHGPSNAPFDIDGNQAHYWALGDHCTPFNLTGQPAVVLPLAQDKNNLPICVQAVGRRWGDERLLAIAKALAEVTGDFRKPPGY